MRISGAGPCVEICLILLRICRSTAGQRSLPCERKALCRPEACDSICGLLKIKAGFQEAECQSSALRAHASVRFGNFVTFQSLSSRRSRYNAANRIQVLFALRGLALLCPRVAAADPVTAMLPEADGDGGDRETDRRVHYQSNRRLSGRSPKRVAKDAEKDFEVNVEVRMPTEATAVEQKANRRGSADRWRSTGSQSVRSMPIIRADLINSVGEKVPLITHDSDAPGDRIA